MTRKNLLYGFITILIGTLWSCDKDYKEIQRASKTELLPTSEAVRFTMKYTDSARIKSVLKSPLMYDYSRVEYPFTEFPEGAHIVMYDQKGKKSFIVADYAVNFSKSELIELVGNVKITSENGDELQTSQIYYDRSREWIFTEKDCKLINNNGVYYVKGFDSKIDLTQAEGRAFTGSGTFSD